MRRRRDRAVVGDHFTHLSTLKSDAARLGTGLLKELGDGVKSKETDEGKGKGEGVLGAKVVGDTSVFGESGEDATAGADLLPLLVAGDGSIL